ncbi:MAG TPA: adenylate/guanylate cyclase domain-containing protein, partial [Acidimicrobiales bacterium]|nr:adenylate/guanylate cyclase domain-containing protein [Acidimicrobiales bacterium]
MFPPSSAAGPASDVSGAPAEGSAQPVTGGQLTPADERAEQLLAYVPRLALEWLGRTTAGEPPPYENVAGESGPAENAARQAAGHPAPAGQSSAGQSSAGHAAPVGQSSAGQSSAGLYKRAAGTLVLVDVSGFTARTERLAAKGRAGTEELNEIVSSTFGELAAIAGRYGADLLKWGGDAALLLFDGPGSASRGARCGWLMARAMRRVGRVNSSIGNIRLKVSVGVHSGTFDLFLVGDSHRELVIAGPGATITTEMEATASPDEVVVSAATAALLDAGVLGEARGSGFLLRSEPRAQERPVLSVRSGRVEDAASLVPLRARHYLMSGDEQAEHRPVAIAFVRLSGLDDLIQRFGAAAALEAVSPPVRAAQQAAAHYGVSFHGTDIATGGVKILLLGGVPTLEGNDADRLLRAALEIVASASVPGHHLSPGPPEGRGPAATRLTVRAGVNVGHAFVSSGLRLGRRRVYSVTGDSVNLAARVVEAARPGQVLCTEAARAALRSPFVLRELPPFTAKGKSGPVVTYDVHREGTGPSHPGQPAPTFVGREAELNSLLAAAARVRDDETGHIVALVGPEGIGKSRLLSEAAERWALPTIRVPCDSFSGGRPYRPLQAAARHILGLDDDSAPDDVASALTAVLEERAAALLPWAPLLADVFGVAVPQTREARELEPRFRQRRLEAAFVELTGMLVTGPAAFIFEDAHALDQASMSLVLRVAGEAEVAPWLVIITHPQDSPAWDEPDGATVVELGPLDAGSSEHLLSELSIERLDAHQRRALLRRAEGNPLFLVELARAANATGSPESLPDALEPLLAAQVDRLAPADRRALRAAAVLGSRFEKQLLARIVEEEVVIDDFLWARLSDFLLEEAGGLTFAHALVRDAAYEGLSFRQRRALHGRAAAAIEDEAKGTDAAVELLSLHWLAAERWDRAWDSARLAGERAAALYANADAATQFGRALDAASHLREVAPAEVARVSELLGDVCELAGTYERARAAYGAAYRRLANGPDRARLLRKTGVLHERRGRYPQALRTYSSALHHLHGADHADLVERCELQLARAGVRHRQGKLRESTADASVAAQDAARAGYQHGLAHALYLRHINSVYLDEPDDSLAEEALSIFLELGDLVGQGNVLNNLGISAHYRGAWPEALEHYRASRSARERTGDLVGAATEENNIGEILSDQGHYAEAERYFTAAKSTWRSARYPIGEALATSNLGRLAARTGQTTKGALLLGEARSAFESIHAGSYVDETDLRLVECQLLAGEPERAAESGAEL